MKSLISLIASMLLMASTAWGTPLTFSAGTQADFDAVTQCIFGGNGPAGCPILTGSSGSAPAATPTGMPGASYSGNSWTYTVGDIISSLGGDNLFNLVIDSNWSAYGGGGNTVGDSEFLTLFEVRINGVVEFDYSGGAPMDDGANGNGNENWLLSTVDLSTFALTDLVDFHLEMTDLTDGFEQVAMIGAGFRNPGPNPMPEPGVLILVGVGLIGIATGRRKLFG